MKKRTQLFLSLLLLSSFAAGGLGLFLEEALLRPLGIEWDAHPIALPFVLLRDEILQAQVAEELEKRNAPATEPPADLPIPTQPASFPTEPATEPATEPPTELSGPVEESWYDDALFIGESRIQGMQAFCRLGQADYFCAASMTVYGILDAKLTDRDFTDCTLEQLLTQRDYGKIFIHLGINEIPVGAGGIMKGYQKILDRIRELEPDAVIVLLGCMSITEQYASRAGFRVDTVHELNGMLRDLAESQSENYRYVDTNSWAAGEDGFLRAELTGDGCHLYGENYAQWCDLISLLAASWDIP